MTAFTKSGFLITATSDAILNASDAFTSPTTGIVVASNSFSGYSLILSSTFANDLYTLMGSPSLYTGYLIYFSPGNGNNFSILTADSNIIIPNSTTFTYNATVNNTMQAVVFQLTQISPPQFTVWG